MSTTTSSLPRPPVIVTTIQTLATAAAEASITAVQGLAFWATILLPLVISATLLTDIVTSSPHLVGGLFVSNVVCAVGGQSYSPRR